MTKRVLLFSAGFVLGGLLYVIGADGSQPAPLQCRTCAVLSPSIHNSACTEAVEGGWICEGH